MPERPKGADCKSAGISLQKFESSTWHSVYPLPLCEVVGFCVGVVAGWGCSVAGWGCSVAHVKDSTTFPVVYTSFLGKRRGVKKSFTALDCIVERGVYSAHKHARKPVLCRRFVFYKRFGLIFSRLQRSGSHRKVRLTTARLCPLSSVGRAFPW